MTGGQFSSELDQPIDRRVYFPVEHPLWFGDGMGQSGEFHVADDHQINVAGLPLTIRGERSKYEREKNAIREWLNGTGEQCGRAHGF